MRGKLADTGVFCVVLAYLMAAGSAGAQQVTGQWDFNTADLKATVGADGSYWLPPAAPPRDVAAETQFGTTTSFGIADINGEPATVMFFPQTDPFMGYAMFPQIDANGGGEYVNQVTIIMDILYPTTSAGGYRALVQTNDCNRNDADFFVNGSDGIGIGGQYDGVLTPGAWHRVVLALNTADTTAGYRKFIDGTLVGSQSGMGLDGRMALYTAAMNRPTLLFADEDNETAPGYVSSIQVRNYQMSDTEVGALGGPTAGKIPGGPGVTGQWDFAAGNLKATVGRDLQYFKGCNLGTCPEQNLANVTQFGLASTFGLPKLHTIDATVMRFPATYPCTGYLFPHGAAANGGGTKVNQYSLIMDVYFKSSEASPDAAPAPFDNQWISLYQLDPVNQQDGKLFIRGSDNALGVLGAYDQTEGSCPFDTWLRIAVVVDTTEDRMSKYVNGVALATQGTDNGVDGTRAMYTKFSSAGKDLLLLFTDNDNETKPGYVSSIQVRDYAMTNEEVAALGGPTGNGIGFADPTPAPDFNSDGRVNDADFAHFKACATGAAIPLAEQAKFDCQSSDYDGDSDVDMDDFGVFQGCYSGSETYDPGCVPGQI